MPIIVQGGGISFDGGFSLGPTIPPPPIIGTATLSNTTASVPFTAPNNDGGEPITSYTAVSNPGNLTSTLNQSGSGIITVANLSYSTSYTFIVYATNILGNSANSSPSNSINVPTQLQTTLAVASKITVQNVSDPFTPVTASGGQLPYTFSISPSLPSGMNFNTGNGQITGAPTSTSSSTSYTVTVTDAVSQISDKTFALQVNSPVSATLVIASKTLNQNTGVGTPFTPVTGANGLTPYVYSISPSLPSGLSINTGNGSISGTPTVTQTSTNHTVTITDAYSQTANNTFTLLVNTELTTTQAIASRQLEQNYSINLPFTPVTASGGTTPYTFSVSPAIGTGTTAGLLFNTGNGQISGTPTSTLGTTTYTVTATDDIGATSNKTFTLNIAAELTTTQAVPSIVVTVDTALASTIPVTASGGFGTKTFSISPELPTGLSFGTSDGSVSGTPTVLSSSTTYTVTVTDDLGITSSKTFTLSVIVASGEQRYTSAGTFTFTVPTGVTSVSVVALGGGASGGVTGSGTGPTYYGGGGGGGLAYRNNVSVTPGQTISVVVGAGGARVGGTTRNPSTGAAINFIGNNGTNSSVTIAGVATTGTGGLRSPGSASSTGAAGTVGAGGGPAGTRTGGGTGGSGGGNGGQLSGSGGGGGAGWSGTAGAGGYNFSPGVDTGGGFTSTGNGGGGGGGFRFSQDSGGRTVGAPGGGGGNPDGYFGLGGTRTNKGESDNTANSITGGVSRGAGGGGGYGTGPADTSIFSSAGEGGCVLIVWPGNTRQFPNWQ